MSARGRHRAPTGHGGQGRVTQARGRHVAPWRQATGAKGRSLTGAVGFVGVGLGASLMLTGLAPARPLVLPWLMPTASQAELLRSLLLTREFAVAPPVEARRETPRQTAPPVEAPRNPEVADPTRVVIPGIGVDAEVVPLGLQPDGGLEVPKDFSKAGWYRDGPEPGEPGAAVVVGHVDSRRAPAVFFRLRELTPGDEVVIHTADGGSVRFVVERVEEHPKSAFPTAAVYGPTPEPTLRLVTCGGTFDRSARRYRGSVVVFAALAASGAGQPSR